MNFTLRIFTVTVMFIAIFTSCKSDKIEVSTNSQMEEFCTLLIFKTMHEKGFTHLGVMGEGTHEKIEKNRYWFAKHSFQKINNPYEIPVIQDVACVFDDKKNTIKLNAF